MVVATAVRNELKLGDYGRRKGPFAEQIASWRTTCRRANDPLPSAPGGDLPASGMELGYHLHRKTPHSGAPDRSNDDMTYATTALTPTPMGHLDVVGEFCCHVLRGSVSGVCHESILGKKRG